jgi:hypothetical protein
MAVLRCQCGNVPFIKVWDFLNKLNRYLLIQKYLCVMKLLKFFFSFARKRVFVGPVLTVVSKWTSNRYRIHVIKCNIENTAATIPLLKRISYLE